MILNNKSLKDEWKVWISEAIDMSGLQELVASKLDGLKDAIPEKSDYEIDNKEKALDSTEIINSLKERTKCY